MARARLIPLCGNIFPCFRQDRYSSVQSMHVIWCLANPTVNDLSSMGRGELSSAVAQKGAQKPTSLRWPLGETYQPWGPMPTIEADLVLSLLCVWKALFCSVLGCVMFFLQLRYQDAGGRSV